MYRRPVPAPFVPPGFTPPRRLAGDRFYLEPLSPRHNERDHDAWMSSIDHIRATPGFPWEGWPAPMPLEENLRDLEQHAADFRALAGFTYTVRSSNDGEVIGCVYIYPDPTGEHDALVRSWVRASHAKLDGDLHRVVTDWLADAWPFARVSYAARGEG